MVDDTVGYREMEKGFEGSKYQKDLLHMQIRLFRMACKKWNKSIVQCADLFDEWGVDDYIDSAYGVFHVQGDDANLVEIEQYLLKHGVQL